ncbi:hypothetical protein [Lentzea flaviverrucosa]|uniref:Uncharacterized protein n=1 Tax=Lentzea flaviverrucosa TaxID=200379 RepID=A0A1H9XT97_9PSEU|nr:hypothetical protein [Lentzea flaviverrucosa]RDI19206.1 hypothetical protein DFR72_11748 [Lentzea flaviverrucosa]SES49400.1 hypothetical protein SAMN05216195_117170 [Lentzea flaviverrucosa]
MKRHTLLETSSRKQMARARRQHTERVLFAVVFTAVELWAVVAAVVLLEDDGVLAVAASVVLSAALIAVWDAWQSVFASGRALRGAPAEETEPDQEVNLVRPRQRGARPHRLAQCRSIRRTAEAMSSEGEPVP